eukprot:1578404-Pleurochrysis_carterae.AAC.1
MQSQNLVNARMQMARYTKLTKRVSSSCILGACGWIHLMTWFRQAYVQTTANTHISVACTRVCGRLPTLKAAYNMPFGQRSVHAKGLLRGCV